ncbi:hypothetical protein Focb16_v005912 [Fusarium oxysporum f. sp. cubense]|uniref:Uncharacterized protein n=2 Tax=Fusarium oxysporum f. sp. cubense TaxID=61366 RepID=N4U8B5_FUSC1|nr:hypothetical protein FOC1_g10001313 [Fusarium oxysporum f. sp. cubense race 1]TVY73706.1 hypothetical protein Focb16_v005912 [Fusarium oxysporum f. sp. cubense]
METGAVVSYSSPDELNTVIPGFDAINAQNGEELDYSGNSDNTSTTSMALRRTIKAELAWNGENRISEVDNRPQGALQTSICDVVSTFDCSSIEMPEPKSQLVPESIGSLSNDPSCIAPTASMVSLPLFPSSGPVIPCSLEPSRGHDLTISDSEGMTINKAGEAPVSSPAESDMSSFSQLGADDVATIGFELDSSLAREFPSSSALEEELKKDQSPCEKIDSVVDKGAGVWFTEEADPVIRGSKRHIDSLEEEDISGIHAKVVHRGHQSSPGKIQGFKRRRNS